MKSKILANAELIVESLSPVINFVRPFAKNYPEDGWDRYLFIRNKPAFYLGTVCETCYFIFRKVPGGPSSVNIERFSDKLNQGLSSIDEDVLRDVSKSLPSGDYGVFLFEVFPSFVRPGSDGDFFKDEIYSEFGNDDCNSVHSEYYLTSPRIINEAKSVFEFIVPMFDHETLDELRVNCLSKIYL